MLRLPEKTANRLTVASYTFEEKNLGPNRMTARVHWADTRWHIASATMTDFDLQW